MLLTPWAAVVGTAAIAPSGGSCGLRDPASRCCGKPVASCGPLRMARGSAIATLARKGGDCTMLRHSDFRSAMVTLLVAPVVVVLGAVSTVAYGLYLTGLDLIKK